MTYNENNEINNKETGNGIPPFSNSVSDKKTNSKNKNNQAKFNLVEEKQYQQKSIVKTYRDYAVKALKDKPTSLAKMIINEKKKEEYQYEYSYKNKKNIFMIVLSTTLVFLGILALFLIVISSINKKESTDLQRAGIVPKSVLFFNYKIENNLDQMSRSDIIRLFSNSIKNTNIPTGDIKIYYFSKKNTIGNNVLANSRDFIKVLDTRAPAQLLRNLENEFNIGIVSVSSKNMLFMVLKVRDFDASYIATIGWEKTMLFDLGDLFGVNKKYYAQNFVDLSLHNKDVRAVLDREGKIVFAYSFLDSNTLVFFESNLGFRNIINSVQNYRKK